MTAPDRQTRAASARADEPQPPAVPGGSLLRGLALLEAVGRVEAASVTGLSAALGLDKGTVSRLLAILRDAGYVRQQPDRSYRLTGRLLQLAQGYLSDLDIRTVARPHLVQLRDEVNETVHLAIRDDDQMLYVDNIEPNHVLRSSSALGRRLPLRAAATGRAVLAALPDSERSAAVRHEIEGHVGEPVLVEDLHRLAEEVEAARAQGWATVERGDGISRIAAAVTDADGRPIAAVSVSGPAERVALQRDLVIRSCRQAATRIGADLGGSTSRDHGAGQTGLVMP